MGLRVEFLQKAERAHLQFQVDAFNVFNHTQFSGINSGINFSSLTNPVAKNLPFDSNGNLVNKTDSGRSTPYAVREFSKPLCDWCSDFRFFRLKRKARLDPGLCEFTLGSQLRFFTRADRAPHTLGSLEELARRPG